MEKRLRNLSEGEKIIIYIVSVLVEDFFSTNLGRDISVNIICQFSCPIIKMINFLSSNGWRSRPLQWTGLNRLRSGMFWSIPLKIFDCPGDWTFDEFGLKLQLQQIPLNYWITIYNFCICLFNTKKQTLYFNGYPTFISVLLF